jgi:hypothetical protein
MYLHSGKNTLGNYSRRGYVSGFRASRNRGNDGMDHKGDPMT